MHLVTVSQDKDKDASGNPINPTGNGQNTDAAAQAALNQTKILVPAGTVNYGQLLTEANSDVPGPILAQIVSGPLAGARAVGHFDVKNDYLVLEFDIADLKKKDYRISAIALDPDTTLGGMATEVDERYFTRVILPAAAAFLQGLGQEIGQPQSTVTSTGTTTIVTQSSQGIREGIYEGLGAAADTAGQFFRDQANRTQPLVWIAAGTPIGIFFTRSVLDETIDENAYNNAKQQTATPAVTNFGLPQMPGQMGQQQYQGPYGNGPLGSYSTGPGYGGGGYGGGGYGGYPGMGSLPRY